VKINRRSIIEIPIKTKPLSSKHFRTFFPYGFMNRGWSRLTDIITRGSFSKKFCYYINLKVSDGKKSQFLSKIEILVKNRNFCQKSKFLSEIKIFVKNRFFFVKNPNFIQKSIFLSKIEILVKNRNFSQTWKFWSKIEILVKHGNFGQKLKF